MREINTLLNVAGKDLKRRSGASQTEAGRNKRGSQSEPGSPDLIDAINQVFAEFELAYHNQYLKAFADPERLILTKKYWLECLSEFHPQQLVTAARRLVKTQPYLPTISAMVAACEEGGDLFGLPSSRDAYLEACRAPAPKAAYAWSHPAVYHAGKATDWFVMASEPEDKVYPLFEHNYQQLCERVMRGESIEEPVTPALQRSLGTPLSDEQKAERLEEMRQKLQV
jgi:hypothetical protein